MKIVYVMLVAVITLLVASGVGGFLQGDISPVGLGKAPGPDRELYMLNTHHTQYIFDKDKLIFGYCTPADDKPVWYSRPRTGAQDYWFVGARRVGYMGEDRLPHWTAGA